MPQTIHPLLLKYSVIGLEAVIYDMLYTVLCVLTVHHSLVSDPEGMCFEFGDFRQRPVDHRRGIPLSAAGDYKCIACNSVGTSFVIFTVEIQGI